ncbi:MAG TPA: hypothetical protein VLA89_02860 [Gemmatimonadales bacterium]|nr:hypothetical protein [Gemmatimonadales bacterium]
MSSILEAFGFPSTEDAKGKLFAEMGKIGAVKLEAHYSGGNDEGGVQSIEVLRNDKGKDIPIPEMWLTRPATAEDRPWQVRDGLVHTYHPLWEAADEMLSTEFGSWAGDFTAYGTLHADVKQKKVWRDGEISSYTDDHNDY